jgi:hypothetical protein
MITEHPYISYKDKSWTLIQLFEQTECIIEGNWFLMWERLSNESWRNIYGPPFIKFKGYNITQLNPGYINTIGNLDDRPITICIFWFLIEGHLVACYEGTSQLVDHNMIEEWLNKTFETNRSTNLDNLYHMSEIIKIKEYDDDV